MSRPSSWWRYQCGRGYDPTIVVGRMVLTILVGIFDYSLTMTGVGVFGTVFFFPRKRRMLSQPERRNQAHRASPGTRAKANAVQLSECGLTVGAVYDRTILLLSSTFLDCEERRAVMTARFVVNATSCCGCPKDARS